MGNEKKLARCNKIVFPVLFILVILIGSPNHARGYNAKETGKVSGESLSLQKNMNPGAPAGQQGTIKRAYIVENGDTFFDLLRSWSATPGGLGTST